MYNYNFLKKFSKNNLICLIIIVFIFFFDRISKIKIIDHQLINESIYINDFINFDLVWNNGIAFGLLSYNANLIYHSITTLIGGVIIFLIYLIFKSELIDKILF